MGPRGVRRLGALSCLLLATAGCGERSVDALSTPGAPAPPPSGPLSPRPAEPPRTAVPQRLADLPGPAVPSPLLPGAAAGRAVTPPPSRCPPSGLALSLGPTDGALGLRAVSVQVTNCGGRTRTLKGYPDLQVLDERRQAMDVQVRHGSATDALPDPGPSPLALAPAATASAELTWRNTVTIEGMDRLEAQQRAAGTSPAPGGDPRPPAGAYVFVAVRPGAQPEALSLHVDVGTTGVVDLGAWHLP